MIYDYGVFYCDIKFGNVFMWWGMEDFVFIDFGVVK